LKQFLATHPASVLGAMVRSREAKSSRAVSVAAVLGLIVVSLLMLYFIDASNLFNPTGPRTVAPAPTASAPAPPGTPLNGSLVVFVTSNVNVVNGIPTPTSASSGTEGAVVVAIDEAANSSQAREIWATNAAGLTGCIACVPVGAWLVSIQYDGLEITTQAIVSVGEQTLVQASFTAKLYDLGYCAESGVLVTPSSAQYTMFASVSSPAAVANASEPVFLNVEGGLGQAGYSVNATVVSQGAPAVGTQWLELGTSSPVDLVDATSISMTAWASSVTMNVGPVTYLQSALER
jgi:hypothetical protein